MTTLTTPEFAWFAEGLLAALVTGLVLALIVSSLLLAAPTVLLNLNRRLSRWVDTGGSLQALERPLMLERFFYRHHRILGALTALGATYVLWRWATVYERSSVIALLDRRWIAGGLDWIVGAVETVVVGLHVLILGVGLVILLRPSLLKTLEQAANHWHRGLSSDSLDAVIDSVDRGITVYPRLSGLILLAASLWSLIALLPVFVQVLGR